MRELQEWQNDREREKERKRRGFTTLTTVPVSLINSFLLNISWQSWEGKTFWCLVIPHSFNYRYHTTSLQTSFFLQWKWAAFNRGNESRGWPTAVLIPSLIFILGEPSQLINLSSPTSRQLAWGGGCRMVRLGFTVWSDVCVCVCVWAEFMSTLFLPSPSTTAAAAAATTSEARGSLAVLVIPQWMWVSEWGFAFVTRQGDRQRGHDPSHPMCTCAQTHTCLRSHAHVRRQRPKHWDAHTHIDTNKKKRHGWMSSHTRPKLTQTKTSSYTNLEYIWADVRLVELKWWED